MKLIDRISWMVGTAFTGVDLLLGNSLREALIVSLQALNDDIKLYGYETLDLDLPEESFPAEFHYFMWVVTIRPALALHLTKVRPSAWYLHYYTLNLKPN